MAYCDQCGAYIPDGQTKCLACGYDETAQAASAAAAQAEPEKNASGVREGSYYSFTNAELKERLAEQRKKQQEDSRRWAEEEKARRQAARESQSAAGAKAKAKPEGETLNWDEVLGKDGSVKAGRGTVSGSMEGDSKIFAALSYLGILFLLPMIFRRRDDFASFHAKQGLILFVFNIISRIVGRIPVLGMVLKLFRFYCIYRGMKNAIDGRKEELPYIGKLSGWQS